MERASLVNLRPYQRQAIADVRAALERSGSVVLQMPTGSGKTVTAAEFIRQESAKGPVWFICHRREIIRQASKAFSALGISHDVIAPKPEEMGLGFGYSPGARVKIASVQTLSRRSINVVNRLCRDGMPHHPRNGWVDAGAAISWLESSTIEASALLNQLGLSQADISGLHDNGFPSPLWRGRYEKAAIRQWIVSPRKYNRPRDIASREEIPDGYVTVHAFCATAPFSYYAVKKFVSDGKIPAVIGGSAKYSKTYIHADKARILLQSIHAEDDASSPLVETTVSGAAFCRLLWPAASDPSKRLADLRARGLPCERGRNNTVRVHIRTALEWVRDNTNIAIPPEAWPKDGDDE